MLETLQRSRTPGGAAYVDLGEGAPLLLIHGVGMRLEAWGPQIQVLARTGRVIAVDMPGHGESAHLPAGSELPEFVAWFASFMDDLGLDAVSVAGHSMGALICLGLAVTSPHRVCRLALLNGVHRRSAEARAAVEARATAIASGAFDREAPLERWFSPQEAGSEAWLLTRDLLLRNDPAGYAVAYGAFARGDLVYADAWPQVAVPALLLTGGDDPNSTPRMAREMAEAAPLGRCHIIEGHRHMVNLTAPDAVNAALGEWLAIGEEMAA